MRDFHEAELETCCCSAHCLAQSKHSGRPSEYSCHFGAAGVPRSWDYSTVSPLCVFPKAIFHPQSTGEPCPWTPPSLHSRWFGLSSPRGLVAARAGSQLWAWCGENQGTPFRAGNKGRLPFTSSPPLCKCGFSPLSPGSQGCSQPCSSQPCTTYLQGIRAVLKTAQVPWSHSKVPESLTHWFREDLPKNRIANSQATQELGSLRGHVVQLPL